MVIFMKLTLKRCGGFVQLLQKSDDLTQIKQITFNMRGIHLDVINRLFVSFKGEQ